MTQWINSRTLYAAHLQNDPSISFFREKDKIHIVWFADNTKDNVAVWTAGNGRLTLDYKAFIGQIELFRDGFFSVMNKQVESAIDKNWDKMVSIDKIQLQKEHVQRKYDFQNKLFLLGSNINKTEWNIIRNLITKHLKST